MIGKLKEVICQSWIPYLRQAATLDREHPNGIPRSALFVPSPFSQKILHLEFPKLPLGPLPPQINTGPASFQISAVSISNGVTFFIDNKKVPMTIHAAMKSRT